MHKFILLIQLLLPKQAPGINKTIVVVLTTFQLRDRPSRCMKHPLNEFNRTSISPSSSCKWEIALESVCPLALSCRQIKMTQLESTHLPRQIRKFHDSMMVICIHEYIESERFGLNAHIYCFDHMLIRILDTTAPAKRYVKREKTPKPHFQINQ